jgi:hypothetical protein
MSIKVVICHVCIIYVISGSAFGQVRSSANYSITTDTIDSGGVNAASANYSLQGSALGEFGSGNQELITSTSYTNKLDYVGQLSDMLDPISAVSRFTHGGAGTFDINLSVFGTRSIECRYGGSNGIYTLIFTFGNPLASVGGVSATSTGGGPAPMATGAIDATDQHHYNVSLAHVPNAQYTTVTLTNVTDSNANLAANVQVTIGYLLGDTTGNGLVNSSDIAQTQSQSGQPVTAANCREDVTVNGEINSSDIGLVQSQSGTALPSLQNEPAVPPH